MHSPFVLVVFGATGDLAKTKLIPALFSLFKQKKLPAEFFIIGFARRELLDEQFRLMFPELSTQSGWAEFAFHLYYQQGKFEESIGYTALINRLSEIDEKLGACITRLFYLATPPINYNDILHFLDTTKLSEGCGQGSSKWTRLIIEKPFGKDLETAIALDKKLAEIFEERQIFRVDHYLGKETVQNMLAFRFANGIFEPVWNKQYIDHVQITFAEKKTAAGRGKFFDGVGILRDVAQNHLLQLLAAVVMEQPTSFSREGVREARAKAIQAIAHIEPDQVAQNVVRGQYSGYLIEPDVVQDSETETFTAMKLFVNADRFAGVPFYIRAGKAMMHDIVEINIVFIQTCHLLFKEYGCPEIGNVLTIRIQPDEEIRLRVIAKQPGTTLKLSTVDMKFTYKDFGEVVADAYEKILLDIFAGDQTLFNRSDELASSWEFITKILNGWKKDNTKPLLYQPGTWGPPAAQELIEKDGKKWL